MSGPGIYEHPATVVEIAHDTVLALRQEAPRRDVSVEHLARELLDVIASDGLVRAVLDDGAPADPPRPGL